jgi:hypothetical protein
MLRRVRAYLRKLAALAQEWVDPNGAKQPKLEEADVDAVKGPGKIGVVACCVFVQASLLSRMSYFIEISVAFQFQCSPGSPTFCVLDRFLYFSLLYWDRFARARTRPRWTRSWLLLVKWKAESPTKRRLPKRASPQGSLRSGKHSLRRRKAMCSKNS